MDIINKQIDINGIVVSPGIAIGEVCHYQSGTFEQTAIYKISTDQIENELDRFNKALEISKKELISLYKNIEETVGQNEAKIFQSHLLLLDDKQLLDRIYFKVKTENLNIEYSVKSVFEEFEALFENMKDEYLKERKIDFIELKKRILSHLTGENRKFLCKHNCLAQHKKGRIILTKELTSSMISILENKNIYGFITQYGGKNSHAALLARSIGIPLITGINIIDNIKCETKVIIDSNNSKVIFNPAIEILDFYNKFISEEKRYSNIYLNYGPFVKTLNGKEIKIYANIINLNDLEYYNKFNLAGIGLVRTEFLFMDYNQFPDQEEQFNVYSEIVKRSANKEITFRLFDLGGDKKIPSLIFNNEENPLLGLRGIRYLLKYKKILYDQLKALCRCAIFGNIKILYPMVTALKELEETNSIFNEVRKELKIKVKIETGMMFEVPSVFIEPKNFIANVDFISIGSNDLIQYLFGVDRNNADVSYLYIQDNSVIYNLIKKVVKEINKQGKSITLCGEIDLKSKFIENIIKIGINKLSIAPISAPKIVERIKQMNI